MKSCYDIILRPVLTEKAYAGIADKRYVFEVDIHANKSEIKKAIEELSELIVSICHLPDGKCSKEDLADELADATIMCEQLRQVYDINDEVCRHMDYKVLRLAQRMRGHDHGSAGGETAGAPGE